jgi:hypothetical protein
MCYSAGCQRGHNGVRQLIGYPGSQFIAVVETSDHEITHYDFLVDERVCGLAFESDAADFLDADFAVGFTDGGAAAALLAAKRASTSS